MKEALTVGQVSETTGLSRKSIRYYEAEKLIPKAQRSVAGYRLYSPAVIGRLRFIQKAKAIGFSLNDIRGVLEITHRGEPCCDRVMDWSDKKLLEIDEHIEFLQRLHKTLSEYQKKWKEKEHSSALPDAEICALIESVKL